MELALAHNPELATASAEVDATGGARLQAQARPNPEVAFLLEDTRRETRTTTLQINQPIELGGKRDARIAAADRATDVARSDLGARRHAVRAAVVTAFFDLLAIQERARVSEASLALTQRSSRAAAQRVQAGKVSPVEETKARVAEASARIELAQLRGEEVGARARLNSAMGQPQGNHTLDGTLTDLPAPLSESTLRAQLNSAPALRRAELEVERRKAMTAVENARRMSDVTISLGAKRDQEVGRNQVVIGLSIPLPLFDRNQGNVLEALKREDKARDELLAARLQIESEAIQARERLAVSRAEAQSLAADVLPGAQSAFDAATKGFELGKFSFLEALDAQRTLLQARTQYLRALAEAHRASADLNRMLGVDSLSNAQ
ncbi:TolC family protein [Variovorax sp. SRS16]|uniref:TolC family protein n=1 Tax=Variovorax sp. SRS16 TaxID=282217 RepID=UPI001E594B91|nr:TolC family protein [Variovorax sp. SRS16]